MSDPPALWLGQEVVARRVRFAITPSARIRGLMWQKSMDPDEALVIEPARQIHTFGMRFPIDALFCDSDWYVVHVATALRPRRLTRWVRRSRRVVEMRSGARAQLPEVGARLRLG